MKTAYFDCFSGISGDMVLGAFVDAGLKKKTLEQELGKLRLTGYTLSARRGSRGGLNGTKLNVSTARSRARGLDTLLKMIDRSRLAPAVKTTASAIFLRLGRAEAKVHRIAISKVHFHEVGAIDSIVDVVGTAIALHTLEIEQVVSSPIALGRGFVSCDHGRLPVPVPAVVELLKGKPTIGTEIEAELTTPTGAAIIATLAECRFGPMPPMTLTASGCGLGQRDNADRPNALRVLIGEVAPASAATDQIVELEANLDDMTPEMIGALFDRFFEAGALDVFTTPIQMKKNRPAVSLSVMAPPAALGAMESIFFEQTTTLGIRVRLTERRTLEREPIRVQTRFGPVAAVQARLNGRVVKTAPEYESCRALADKKKLPLRVVMEAAVAALARRAAP